MSEARDDRWAVNMESALHDSLARFVRIDTLAAECRSVTCRLEFATEPDEEGQDPLMAWMAAAPDEIAHADWVLNEGESDEGPRTRVAFVTLLDD